MRFWLRVEYVVASFILALLLVRIAPLVHAMATTSLWNDEIYTINQFSARGLWVTLTDYHAPNNHIFFNALNSVLPGADSVQPLRARLLSFAALAASLGVLVGFFFKSRRPLEGVICAAVIFNGGCLGLILQARGYGLLTFFAIVLTLSTIQFFRTGTRRSLVLLSTSVVLGTWTVPIFLAFSAPLLLLVFFSTRDRRAFVAGAVALVCVSLAYAPVLGQLLEQSQSYSERWGRRFASLDAIARSIQDYLPLGGRAEAFSILAAALLAPSLGGRGSSGQRRSLRLLAVCVAVFFAACLKLGTPLPRTTAFAMVPIATILVVSIGHLSRQRRFAVLRPVILWASALAMAVHTYHGVRVFQFVPFENWKGTAEVVDVVFPDRMPLHCDFRTPQLAGYLKGAATWVKELDEAAFVEGRQVYVQTARDVELKKSLRRAAEGSHALISVRQRSHGEQLIIFYPPMRSGVEAISFDGRRIDARVATDRSRSTTWRVEETSDPRVELQVDFTKEQRWHSAVILWGACPVPSRQNVSVRSVSHGVGDALSTERFGDVTVVAMADREVSSIILQVQAEGPICIDEIWAYPAT